MHVTLFYPARHEQVVAHNFSIDLICIISQTRLSAFMELIGEAATHSPDTVRQSNPQIP